MSEIEMNINAICPQCGGYLNPYVTWIAGHSISSIKFCTCAANLPRVEPVYIPVGASIYPNDCDVLWHIAQEVAEKDITEYRDTVVCRFCDAEQGFVEREVSHKPECIVTKARELMAARKEREARTPRVVVNYTGSFPINTTVVGTADYYVETENSGFDGELEI